MPWQEYGRTLCAFRIPALRDPRSSRSARDMFPLVRADGGWRIADKVYHRHS
ncbi:hypothetical protein ACE1SV_68300 [Streptomyces sp. E-15]